jgi:hypothetical protein
VTCSVCPEHCHALAKLRRRLQRIPKEQLLFLDQTTLRTNAAPTHTIVAPGEQPYVEATDTTAYAARYDMIACCSYTQVFPPKIFSPSDRERTSVRGINKAMLHNYIQYILGPATGALDVSPLTLVLDRATIHNEEELLQEFRDWGGGNVLEVIKMPTQGAKRISPLDNSIFHDWKQACRKHAPLTDRNIVQVMADEWNRLVPRILQAHYKHCGLIGNSDPYFDCPAPAKHNHNRHRRA